MVLINGKEYSQELLNMMWRAEINKTDNDKIMEKLFEIIKLLKELVRLAKIC